MKETELKALVYRACLAAVWSDRAMSPLERTRLASLVESFASDEAERALLRAETLREVKPELVLAEVASLDAAHRRAVFEECLAVLAEDRELGRPDMRFLRRLRRACGLSVWAFEARLFDLWRQDGVRVFGWKKLALAAAALAAGAWAILRPAKSYPLERPTGLAVILPAASLTGASRLDAEGVYRRDGPSVVVVEVLADGKRTWEGSGAVIGSDAKGGLYIVTNRHVVRHRFDADADISFQVRFPRGPARAARLEFWSRRFDLALLYLASPPSPAPAPLPLAERSALSVGEPVFVLGTPIGLKFTLTAGIVSALRADALQTDAAVEHGSSGGPVLDQEGRVCGVMTRSVMGKGYSFALYGDDVLAALGERSLVERLRPR